MPPMPTINWSAEQLAVFTAVDTSTRSLSVESCAGSGKSTTLLEIARRLVARGEAVKILCFGRSTAKELKQKTAHFWTPQRGLLDVRNLHGEGFVALDDHFGGSRESRAARIQHERTGGGGGAQPARIVIQPGQTPAQARKAAERAAEAPVFEGPGWHFDKKAGEMRALAIADRVSSKPDKLAGYIQEIADRVKNTLVDPKDDRALRNVVRGLGLAKNDSDAGRLAGLAAEALQAALTESTRGDYVDMLWLAVQLDAIPAFPGTVLLDESQDLTPLQHEAVRRVLASAAHGGGRLVQFGDPAQSIFEWNGAAPDGMRRLAASVDARPMYLNTSFRCPQAVTADARRFRPNIQSDPSCGAGFSRKGVTVDEFLEEVDSGAVVLSRTGRGAFEACLALREIGKQAIVTTHGAAHSMLRLINQTGAKTIEHLQEALNKMRADLDRELPVYGDAAVGQAAPLKHLASELDALRALSAGQKTLDDLRRLIQQSVGRGRGWRDAQAQRKDPSTVIRCGTVHWFKGQEAPDVWLLEDTFHDAYGPHATDEGRNILHVAITRSKWGLHYVSGQFRREESGRRFW